MPTDTYARAKNIHALTQLFGIEATPRQVSPGGLFYAGEIESRDDAGWTAQQAQE
jgi:hypothetical protein